MSELVEPFESHDPAPVTIHHLRRFLYGRWSLERRISDRRGRQSGRLSGFAVFSQPETVPESSRVAVDALVWTERGLMQLGDFSSDVARTYRCVFPATDRGKVLFSDGRYFHDLDLTAGTWRVTHPCGEDLYTGVYHAVSSDRLRVRWWVSGPRKDYTLDTVYHRILGAARGIPTAP